jgi:hypothetical protein
MANQNFRRTYNEACGEEGIVIYENSRFSVSGHFSSDQFSGRRKYHCWNVIDKQENRSLGLDFDSKKEAIAYIPEYLEGLERKARRAAREAEKNA